MITLDLFDILMICAICFLFVALVRYGEPVRKYAVPVIAALFGITVYRQAEKRLSQTESEPEAPDLIDTGEDKEKELEDFRELVRESEDNIREKDRDETEDRDAADIADFLDAVEREKSRDL